MDDGPSDASGFGSAVGASTYTRLARTLAASLGRTAEADGPATDAIAATNGRTGARHGRDVGLVAIANGRAGVGPSQATRIVASIAIAALDDVVFTTVALASRTRILVTLTKASRVPTAGPAFGATNTGVP